MTGKRDDKIAKNEFWLHCHKCGEPVIRYTAEGSPVGGDVVSSADFDLSGTSSEGTHGPKLPRCQSCNAPAYFEIKYLYPLRFPQYRETKSTTMLEF